MSTLSHVFRRDLARKLGYTAHLSPNLALSSFRSYARLVQRAPSFFSPAGVARSGLPYTPSSRRWATSTTPHSTASDPAEIAAIEYLEQGTQKLEDGDVQGAKELYQRSVDIKRNASSLFNLGVTHYHLKEFDEAISAWKESVELQPSSPDAHTNLANAYIVSPLARPDLALNHLQIAVSLAPEDPEIAFNLAAVLEACGRLEDALFYYKRSKQFGVDRAEMHIRNVSAKILGQRMREAEVEVQAGDKPDSDKT